MKLKGIPIGIFRGTSDATSWFDHVVLNFSYIFLRIIGEEIGWHPSGPSVPTPSAKSESATISFCQMGNSCPCTSGNNSFEMKFQKNIIQF